MAGGRVADNICKFLAMDDKNKNCGNCLLCIHTYQGGESSITDNPVSYGQEACIDWIQSEDDEDE